MLFPGNCSIPGSFLPSSPFRALAVCSDRAPTQGTHTKHDADCAGQSPEFGPQRALSKLSSSRALKERQGKMLIRNIRPNNNNLQVDADQHQLASPGSATYWGIRCRTCGDLVAFDTPPYHEFGLASANSKPGAICCDGGHYHIYFPRDFQFFSSETRITDATLKRNCEAYHATNAVSNLRTGTNQ